MARQPQASPPTSCTLWQACVAEWHAWAICRAYPCMVYLADMRACSVAGRTHHELAGGLRRFVRLSLSARDCLLRQGGRIPGWLGPPWRPRSPQPAAVSSQCLSVCHSPLGHKAGNIKLTHAPLGAAQQRFVFKQPGLSRSKGARCFAACARLGLWGALSTCTRGPPVAAACACSVSGAPWWCGFASFAQRPHTHGGWHLLRTGVGAAVNSFKRSQCMLHRALLGHNCGMFAQLARTCCCPHPDCYAAPQHVSPHSFPPPAGLLRGGGVWLPKSCAPSHPPLRTSSERPRGRQQPQLLRRQRRRRQWIRRL